MGIFLTEAPIAEGEGESIEGDVVGLRDPLEELVSFLG